MDILDEMFFSQMQWSRHTMGGLLVSSNRPCGLNPQPFPCRCWNNHAIYKHSMLSHLDSREKVKADNGYVGLPSIRRPNKCRKKLSRAKRNNQQATGNDASKTFSHHVAVICQLAAKSSLTPATNCTGPLNSQFCHTPYPAQLGLLQ